MGVISVSLPSDGSTADVADVNTPITTIVNAINGSLDNSNIAVAAGIDPAKLANAIPVTKFYNPYKFSVYRTAAYNYTSADHSDDFPFDTVEFDTSSNYSTSAYKFTAPVAGFYHLEARLSSGSSSSNRQIIYLYKNGNVLKRGDDTTAPFAGVNVATIVQLAVGDYITVRYYNSGAAAADVSQATCYFQGFFISTT